MKVSWAERTLIVILLVIAAGIVIHTPLTLWLGTIWPQYELIIKAWKEVLMGVALVLLIVATYRRRKMNELLSDRLMQLSLVYAGLHFIMMAVFQNGLQTVGAGLLIDLRYVLYFVLVYGTIRLLPYYRRLFAAVLTSGAVVVLGFALLQVFVLPKDVLTHIGYSKETISPYLTVDENPDYIRINSTLRGPNPLGAYAVIIIGLLAAVVVRWKLRVKDWWLFGGVAAAAGLTLGASYSRSSAIGAIIAIFIIVVISATKKIRKQLLLAIGGATLLIIGTLFVLRDNSVIANVIWHDSPTTGASVDSNAGHADSLLDGTKRLLVQPFGAGVGSTGSASLLDDKPVIIENHYLLIAHEVGWIGLIIFAWLFGEVLRRLWQRRKSALALGVFGSGIGLATIGLLLPVWTDDTVSIVWWGLAAVAVASIEAKRKKHGTRTSN